MYAMEAEHCLSFGSNEDFEAVVNKIILTTCPCKEWKFILEPNRALLLGRKHLDIEQLNSHPISKAAGLHVFEIISILLYTGPMVNENDFRDFAKQFQEEIISNNFLYCLQFSSLFF
jgi:hypothetical protein